MQQSDATPITLPRDEHTMNISIEKLRMGGHFTWPSLLTFAMFGLIAFQSSLLFVSVGMSGYIAFIIRSIYIIANFATTFVIIASALKLSDAKRISAFIMAAAYFAIGCIGLFQDATSMIGMSRENQATEILFILSYLLAIIAIGMYYEWSLGWLGSIFGIILNGVIVGYSILVIASDFLSKSRISGVWIPHLDGYLAIDAGITFALILIALRYGKNGGPGLVIGVAAMVCLVLGDVVFTYFFSISPIKSSIPSAPLYSLNGVLVGYAYYRSVYQPPKRNSENKYQYQSRLERFAWIWAPRQLLFIAFVKLLLFPTNSSSTIFALIILGVLHEGITIVDYQRVNKFIYSLYAREQQAHYNELEQKERAEIAHQKLRAYMLQIEELAAEQERIRVAREIHDGLGHHLNNVKIYIGVAHYSINTDREAMIKSIAIAKEEVCNAQRELRRAIDALISEDYLEGPLEDLLTDLVRDCHLAGIKTHVQTIGITRHLPEQVRHGLFRIGQEALSNIQKHSYAKNATIIIEYRDSCVILTVADDGIGMPSDVEQQRGHGLNNLQERAAFISGKITIETHPGQGVRVVVEAPT